MNKLDYEFKEAFDAIKKTLPKKHFDGYYQLGQTVYNENLDRIEIFGKEGGLLCITNEGIVEADIAPFCG